MAFPYTVEFDKASGRWIARDRSGASMGDFASRAEAMSLGGKAAPASPPSPGVWKYNPSHIEHQFAFQVSEREPGVWQVYGPHGILPEKYGTVAEARAVALAGKREWEASRRAFNDEDKRLQDEAVAAFSAREEAKERRQATYNPPAGPGFTRGPSIPYSPSPRRPPTPPKSSPGPPPPPNIPAPQNTAGWKKGMESWAEPVNLPSPSPPSPPPSPQTVQPPNPMGWKSGTSAWSTPYQTSAPQAPPRPPAPQTPVPTSVVPWPQGASYYQQSAPLSPHPPPPPRPPGKGPSSPGFSPDDFWDFMAHRGPAPATGKFPSGTNYYPQSAPPTPHDWIHGGVEHGPAAPGFKDFFGKHLDDLKDVLQKAHPRGGWDWRAIGQTMGKAFVAAGNAPASVGVPAGVAAAARFGGAAAGPAGLALASIILVNDQLARFAERITESNRRLIPFNGSIMAAYTQLDFGDFRRTFALAHATAPTAVHLAQSMNASRDAWFPVDQFQANVSNRLGIFGAEYTGAIGSSLSAITSPLNTLMERLDSTGVLPAVAGRTAGYLSWVAGWATAGFVLSGGNPLVAAAAGAYGAGTAVAGAFMEGPKGPDDPWGDFFKRAPIMPSLPARPDRPPIRL